MRRQYIAPFNTSATLTQYGNREQRNTRWIRAFSARIHEPKKCVNPEQGPGHPEAVRTRFPSMTDEEHPDEADVSPREHALA